MKPFCLEKALAGEPVVTRDGQRIKILTANSSHPTHPVVGERIDTIDAMALRWVTNGRYSDGGDDVGLDLFMAPVKKQEWVNIHKNDYCYFIGFTVFDNERSAVKAGYQSGNYIKSVLVSEWEE